MDGQIDYEKLYFFYIALKVELIKIDEYEKRIHDLFLANDDQNDVFLELEFCSGDIDQTINALNRLLYEKTERLDFRKFGKILFNEFKRQYDDDPGSLEALTHKMYAVWTLLPKKVAEKKPFIKLNSIDDAWSWDGKEKVLEDFISIINYY